MRPGRGERRLGAPKRGVLCLALLLALGAFAFPPVAGAAPGDIGFEGPSSAGAGSAPTGSKPESKLWWNDGFWWASIWHALSEDFHIFRLEVGSQTWVDTGVALDDRPGTRADVLWDGAAGKLYVASHRFSESPASGYPSRLYRFGYNASTDSYSRDPGFPVTINDFRTETLVIEKDSTGQLWATWTQGGTVWVNRTLCDPSCDDASWGTAFSLDDIPEVKSDDISSLIAFGGNRVGLMWSNQKNWTFGFAIHQDSQADDVWSVEAALSGTRLSDDHINLKADSDGRVYAAIKTSKSSSNEPLTMLLVRRAGGGWSNHVFGLAKDDHTRPIVILDEANGLVRMYATDSGSGGSIMEKTSPLEPISFAPGKGTPVITDTDGKVNNATSTKQNLTPASGLVLLAHSSSVHYMYSFQPVGGGPPLPPPSSPPGPPGEKPGRCTIRGTSGDDVLVGTPRPEVICGRGGRDVLLGRGGADVLIGGWGRDVLKGGRGRDVLLGGRSRDTLAGGRDGDRLVGGRSRDVLRGNRGRDVLVARDGRPDVVRGGPAADRARVDRRLDIVRSIAELF
ncbi:MAG: calcium-binding protein [Gaiellaceae bacterium]